VPNNSPKSVLLVTTGVAIFTAFVLLFGSWMFLVPLDSAAMAPGKLVIEGRSKRIQHYEGGIISLIHVAEGEVVEAGAPLLDLDSTRAQASQDLLLGQFLGLLAQQDRLIAEQKQHKDIEWSDRLRNSTDSRRFTFMREQHELFTVRKRQFLERVAIIRERIDKNNEAISQLTQQIQQVKRQESSYRTEVGIVGPLVEERLAAKTQLLALQRELSAVLERKSALQSRFDGLKYDNRENEVQLAAQESNFLSEVNEKLALLSVQYTDLEQRLLAGEDVLNRTQVRAPISGQVVNLAVTTVGGTVGSGEPLMDIVPQSGSYLVEARVRPVDIDVVTAGQTASIRFSAYSRRYMPAFDGKLTSVSADRIEDPSVSEEPFYLAQIELDAEAIVSEGVRLQPGMPIEVTIKTEARTFADYLFEPVMRSFDRSFQL